MTNAKKCTFLLCVIVALVIIAYSFRGDQLSMVINKCFDAIDGTELMDPDVLYKKGDFYRAKVNSTFRDVGPELNAYLKPRIDGVIEIRLVGRKGVLSAGEVVSIDSYDAESREKNSTHSAIVDILSDNADCNPYIKKGCEGSARIQFTKLEAQSVTKNKRAFYLQVSTSSGVRSPFIFGLNYEKIGLEDVWVLIPDYTWAAYNSFGGGSFYNTKITEGSELLNLQRKSRLYSVNLDRPTDSNINNENYQLLPHVMLSNCLNMKGLDRDACLRKFRTHPEGILVFGRILESKGVRFSYVPMSQLTNKLNPVNPRLIVIGSHNEYWTSDNVNFLKEHLAKGANVLNVSGNVAWWQINRDNTMIHLDQIGQYRSARCKWIVGDDYDETGNYGTGKLPNMVNLFGVGYKYGGYGIQNIKWEASNSLEYRYRGDSRSKFKVKTGDFREYFDKNNHYKGDPIIIDDEIDGAPLIAAGSGLLLSELGDGYGKAELLGVSNIVAVNRVTLKNGSEYFGDIDSGIFLDYCPVGGGRVLNVASIGFSYALMADDTVTAAFFWDLYKSINNRTDKCR